MVAKYNLHTVYMVIGHRTTLLLHKRAPIQNHKHRPSNKIQVSVRDTKYNYTKTKDYITRNYLRQTIKWVQKYSEVCNMNTSTELYIICWSELSRCKLSPTLATAQYCCPWQRYWASSPIWTQSVRLAFGGSWAKIFTEIWQPWHSCSSKMAVRWWHCGL